MPSSVIVNDMHAILTGMQVFRCRCAKDMSAVHGLLPEHAVSALPTIMKIAPGRLHFKQDMLARNHVTSQESALVETPDLPASKPSPDPVAPMTPKRNADAKDPHPWEASWGDLLSSQETDSEFDSDSSLSNSTASGSSSSDLPNEQAAALGDAKIRPADPSVGSPPGSLTCLWAFAMTP